MSNMNEIKAIWAKVHGRVQGVGFRFSTVSKARKLALNGYVKNMADGTVEVVAEGNENNIKSLLEWLKKGPAYSHVINVDSQYITPHGCYRNFQIEY